MASKKKIRTSSSLLTPDQLDSRGHFLFDRNKQKNKINNLRGFQYYIHSKFANLLLRRFSIS
jgi:hypothetical protein